MTGIRQLLPLAVVMAVGACADRHEHIGVIYDGEDFAVGLTEIRESDGTIWQPQLPDSGSAVFRSASPLIDAVFADGVKALGAMFACDSGGVGLSADIAVASGGALIDPDGAAAMLRRQAGLADFGGWPLSGGSLYWIPAAWHTFCANGDTIWLREAYEMSRRMLSQTLEVGWDPYLGLLRGQSPAWRAGRPPFYPRWADAGRRFESVTLGGNVALFAAINALERMRGVVAADTECPAVGARYLERRINAMLWDPGKGSYSAYLYGGPLMDMQAPVADNIGQAVAVLSRVATDEMSASLLSRATYVGACVPDLYPLMAGMRAEAAFANAPMLQMLWGAASALCSREDALRAAIASLCRMYASGSESDASAWLALLVMKSIMGIDVGAATMEFHPLVPQCLGGEMSLSGLRYGDAVVDLNIKGFGSRIARFEIDGEPTPEYCIPSSVTGRHRVDIQLANNSMSEEPVTEGYLRWLPPTPEVTWHTQSSGRIADYSGSLDYSLVTDGLPDLRLSSSGVSVGEPVAVDVVGVVATGSDGLSGFCSDPRLRAPRGAVSRFEVEEYCKPGTDLVRDHRASQRYVESGVKGRKRKDISITFSELQPVDCIIDVGYANGNGQAGDAAATALRRVTVNGEDAGIVVMPPRGKGWWLSTGYSSGVRARLRQGVNDISVSVVDFYGDPDVSGVVLVDNIRVIRLTEKN